MSETIAPPDYEPQARVRTVDETGRITVQGRRLQCPKALAGKRVALRATHQDGVFDLCYRRFVLAQIDLRQNERKPVHHVPEQASTLSPV